MGRIELDLVISFLCLVCLWDLYISVFLNVHKKCRLDTFCSYTRFIFSIKINNSDNYSNFYFPNVSAIKTQYRESYQN